ncbi:MAG: serine--tRNA ligase, partial [Pseudomonadota bacterium]
MHDIQAIRDNAAAYDAAWARRGMPKQTDAILALDAQLRAAKTAKQEAEAARNAASKQIGAAKAQKNEAEAQRLMGEVANLKEAIERESAKEADLAKQLHDILAALPNLPAADVPDGEDEHGNVERAKIGVPRAINDPKDHVVIGEAMGLMDFEAAARISGARFVALKGELARMERALAAFMIDLHTEEYGYTEIAPPVLVKDQAAFGTGQLPKFADDLFRTQKTDWEAVQAWQGVYLRTWLSEGKEDRLKAAREIFAMNLESGDQDQAIDGLIDAEIEEGVRSAFEDVQQQVEAGAFADQYYLVPTAEVPLTNLYNSQIVDESALPIRMTADTLCFRSEAGAAGKDTRGMIRMHQFRKVELVSIVAPEESEAEHERMTSCAEEVLRRLDLPFRRMLLCTG